MLTNKIFDTFLGALQYQTTRPPVSSLVQGQLFEEALEIARLEFEDALSSKLLALSIDKQNEFLTQILALFKSNEGLILSQPAYLWRVDKLRESGLIWYREPNESPAVKTFRDECERHIETNLESFLAPIRAFRESAKEASHFVRLVIDHAPGTIDGVAEMELDYEEGRWIEEGLRARVGSRAKENVWQHFEKLAGKEAAAHWIINPERWYDTHREIQGLPLIQEPFQNSYEAFHFYHSSDLRTAAAPEHPDEPAPTPANSPWEPLLIGKMDLPAFFGFLADCGLMTTNGKLTTLGQANGKRKDRKAPWFGTLKALIDSKHLDNNAAWVCRAMIDPAGQINIKLSDNGLLYPSVKASNYLNTANGHLDELGLLRK